MGVYICLQPYIHYELMDFQKFDTKNRRPGFQDNLNCDKN